MAPSHPWEHAPSGPAAGRVRELAALVPEVLTPRLRLRAPRLGDFPIFAEDIDWRGAYPGSEMPDRETLWLDFCQMVASWALRGFGLWSIDAKTSGVLLGFLSIDHEYGDPEPEIGWMLTRAAEGRGYATEAARAAAAHAFDELRFDTLAIYVDKGNLRSIRVAERLGASVDTAAARPKEGLLTFRLDNPGAGS